MWPFQSIHFGHDCPSGLYIDAGRVEDEERSGAGKGHRSLGCGRRRNGLGGIDLDLSAETVGPSGLSPEDLIADGEYDI